MRKLKVYIDTSVISYFQQEDAPERMKDTLALWKEFKNERYDIYLSQVTMNEIGKCSEAKSVLYDHLSARQALKSISTLTDISEMK